MGGRAGAIYHLQQSRPDTSGRPGEAGQSRFLAGMRRGRLVGWSAGRFIHHATHRVLARTEPVCVCVFLKQCEMERQHENQTAM